MSPAGLAVVGIGNELAGDDGVGPAVVRALAARWGDQPRVRLAVLDGDLLAVSELLEVAPRLVFVDAVAGEPPGELVQGGPGAPVARAFAPSLHQLDIGAVMASLEALGVAAPFPRWELWGVTVAPPRELRQGLSEPVASAVARLVTQLDRLIEQTVGHA